MQNLKLKKYIFLKLLGDDSTSPMIFNSNLREAAKQKLLEEAQAAIPELSNSEDDKEEDLGEM